MKQGLPSCPLAPEFISSVMDWKVLPRLSLWATVMEKVQPRVIFFPARTQENKNKIVQHYREKLVL